MSTREQFEAAVIERFKASGYLPVEIRTELLQRSGDDYHDGSVSAYWHFWQASRQALVVELPEAYVLPPATDYDTLTAACRQQDREAIEAAGVRMKP